jgi:hypothetical protein
MAKLEPRTFKHTKHLLVLAETEQESKLIDEQLGSKIPTQIHGQVTLADGYGEHYIRLQKPTYPLAYFSEVPPRFKIFPLHLLERIAVGDGGEMADFGAFDPALVREAFQWFYDHPDPNSDQALGNAVTRAIRAWPLTSLVPSRSVLTVAIRAALEEYNL